MLRAPSQHLLQRTTRSLSINLVRAAVFSFVTVVSSASYSADLATLQSLPLFTMDKLEYAGGFRFPVNDFGESSIKYSEGIIALGANGKSMFVVGHTYQQAIGEFTIPALVNSLNVTDFKYASVIQNFRSVLGRPESGNTQGLDRIGGMAYINGQLVVNAYLYYDASGGATHTTLVVKNAANLASSAVGGYHRYSARAHASGWLSKIPSDWQSQLGGTYITGNSSGKPIVSRLSVGPSAFVFDPTNPSIGGLSPSAINLTTLLDFSMAHAVGISASESFDSYMYNSSRTNKLWSHLAHAAYGFIVPGTRTYMTLGMNAGMTSGIGYHFTLPNGEVCGGYCPYDASDVDNYYWLWDMNDLLKVKAGLMNSYDVKPYAYGRFNKSYAHSGFNEIVGGAFDESTNILYLTLSRGDPELYSGAPTVVAFKVNTNAAIPSPPQPPINPSATVIN